VKGVLRAGCYNPSFVNVMREEFTGRQESGANMYPFRTERHRGGQPRTCTEPGGQKWAKK